MRFFNRFMFPISLALLGFGFWRYPDFEVTAAGIAIFLFGLMLLKQGVQGFSGGFLEQALKNITRSTTRAVLLGFSTTALVQSSAIIMVLAISFLSAGMLPLLSGIGIVVGANIGTTTGSWLIASFGLSMNLSKLALPLLVFGVLFLFQKSSVGQGFGQFLMGLGFLFLGIDYIKDGFGLLDFGFDLNQIAPNIVLGVLLFTLIGFVITLILQSSHATLLITLSALAAEHIDYTLAVALTMGACVGTTMIPLISSLGANASGKRLALAHFLFNLFTLLVALPLLPVLLWMVDHLAVVLGIGAETSTLKVALFHTLFSLLGSALILPQKSRFEKLLLKLIKEPESNEEKPKFLHPAALESSSTAVAAARNESLNLYELGTLSIVEGLGWDLAEFYSGEPFDELKSSQRNIPFNMRESYQLRIKGIYSELIGFISSARERSQELTDEQLRELWAANYHLVEAVKATKHLQRNLKLYLHHNNRPISDSYKAIRQQIGEVIRSVNSVRNTDDPIESRLLLDHQQLLIERHRDETNSLIAGLIRQSNISNQMATSLMTDKGYAYNVCSSLIRVGRMLFVDASKPQTFSDDTLVLESEDLSAINEQLSDLSAEEPR